jgi:hypothetical protein
MIVMQISSIPDNMVIIQIYAFIPQYYYYSILTLNLLEHPYIKFID